MSFLNSSGPPWSEGWALPQSNASALPPGQGEQGNYQLSPENGGPIYGSPQRRSSGYDQMGIWAAAPGSAGSAVPLIWLNQRRGSSTGLAFGELFPINATQVPAQMLFDSRRISDLLYDQSRLQLALRRHLFAGDVQQQQPQQFAMSPQYQHARLVPAHQLAQPPHSVRQPQLQQQSQLHLELSPHASFNADLVDVAQLTHEYFLADPHERVGVTLGLLEDRFSKEEKYFSEAHDLPNFPVENSLRNYALALVGFKAGRIDVFHLPINRHEPWVGELRVGDLVIVEADRGRDLGKILKLKVSLNEARMMKLLQFQEQQAALSDLDVQVESILSIKNLHQVSNPPILHFPKPVLRVATASEVELVLNKKQDEEKACRLCLTKISNTTSIGQNDLMQMKLIDAEYQFDRKKLIFYYSTSRRIDFRDLVRELFRIYKTRIWMCAVIGLPYIPQPHAQRQPPQRPLQQPSTQTLPQQLPQSQSYPFGGPINSRSTMIDRMEMGISNDSFRYQGQYFQPQVNAAEQVQSDRRLSEPFEMDAFSVRRRSSIYDGLQGDDYVPRKFDSSRFEADDDDERDSTRESSFVLKSLVDSINH